MSGAGVLKTHQTSCRHVRGGSLVSLAGDKLPSHGTADPVVDIRYSRKLKDIYPECRYVEIEGGGHGESGDRYLYYGKKERFDIAGWTEYAARNLTADIPIYVMGMSAGALSTLMSVSAGLHKNTKGIILDSCEHEGVSD